MGGWLTRGVLAVALMVLAAPGGGPAADLLYNRGDLALAGATIDGEVISSAGSTITVDGVVVFNGPFHGAAEFHGRGTAVFNGGTSPGDSPAIVTVEGGVRFGPANTLLIELGGTALGAFDRLEIQGALEAGGTLVVALLPGFAGNVGDSYEIFTAAAITGSFAYVPPAIGAGLMLALRQTATSMTLTVAADCNGNGLADAEEIAQGLAQDCNGNQVPDGCDLAGAAGDSNANGFLDSCEVSRLDVTHTELSWTPLGEYQRPFVSRGRDAKPLRYPNRSDRMPRKYCRTTLVPV